MARKRFSDLARATLGDARYEQISAQAREEVEIARQIAESRKAAGLTQEQLAERMGTSQSTIARLESGACLPSMTSVRKVARALGKRVKVTLEPDGVVARGKRRKHA